MKATIYNGPKDICLKEMNKPSPDSNDVIIRNMRSGICGTDIHAYLLEGESVGINPGNEFGHEMVGIVDEVGDNVEGIKKGMRVFVNPTNVKPIGWNGLSFVEIADMAGAFSEYILVKEAKIGYNLFLLPDELSFDKAVLTEPYSVATHAVSLAQVQPGDRALVYGGGIIGLCTLIALKANGVKEVVVSEVKENRLAMVEKLGGIPFDAKTGNVMDFLKNKFGTVIGNHGEETIDVDIIMDCAGYDGILGEVMENAKALTRYVVVAFNSTEVPVKPFTLIAKELTIVGSSSYTVDDIPKAIESLNHEENNLDGIITSVYSIDQVKEAFEKATDADEEIKVVMSFE